MVSHVYQPATPSKYRWPSLSVGVPFLEPQGYQNVQISNVANAQICGLGSPGASENNWNSCHTQKLWGPQRLHVTAYGLCGPQNATQGISPAGLEPTDIVGPPGINDGWCACPKFSTYKQRGCACAVMPIIKTDSDFLLRYPSGTVPGVTYAMNCWGRS